jgi:anaerobic ribonucleoside-triphosphate reductase
MQKCIKCNLIFKDRFEICPVCNEELLDMCEYDTGICNHAVIDGIAVCPICGEFMCPECHSHDVSAISRVTGYYSPVGSWCEGKKQELKDRHRYTIEE